MVDVYVVSPFVRPCYNSSIFYTEAVEYVDKSDCTIETGVGILNIKIKEDGLIQMVSTGLNDIMLPVDISFEVHRDEPL